MIANHSSGSIFWGQRRNRLLALLTLLGLLGLTMIAFRPQPETFEKPTEPDDALVQVGQLPHHFSSTIDAQELADAKLSILFVGNSHTGYFDLVKLVTDLINHRRSPDRAVGVYHSVSFLDEAMNDQHLLRELESKKWDAIVLQAQKISSSGKHMYPTDDGVKLAKHSLRHGCRAYYFAEWGIQDVPGHTAFTEGIYQAMADESGAQLIPVGRVWEAVLAEQPELKLYSSDKNHQSRLGASLTALVIACYLLDEPANLFAEYDNPEATDEQWKLFIEHASKVQGEEKR